MKRITALLDRWDVASDDGAKPAGATTVNVFQMQAHNVKADYTQRLKSEYKLNLGSKDTHSLGKGIEISILSYFEGN